MRRTLSASRYVDRDYDEVVGRVRDAAESVLQPETDRAMKEVSESVVTVAARILAFELRVDVVARLGPTETDPWGTRIPVMWTAAAHPGLLPALDATLEVSPLRGAPYPITEVALVCRYEPPLGLLGALGDTAFGHRIAEASLERLLDRLCAEVSALVADVISA